MPEVEMPQVGLAGPVPTMAADYVSMAGDLRFVVACCDMLLELEDAAGADGPESTVRRALMEAAVISYGRSFATGRGHGGGRRTPFPEAVLESLDPEQASLHVEMRLHRNKHIGHREDDREQTRVVALLNHPSIAWGVAGVGFLMARQISGGEDDLRAIRDLAATLAAGLEAESEALQQQLLEEMGPRADELYRQVGFVRVDPTGEDEERPTGGAPVRGHSSSADE